jgi:2-haloalkanoic acid dehalogenase type II
MDERLISSRYDAVLFDLLTALLDSWSLWNAVAGSETNGRRWREEYLRITYRTGRYRPYEALVGEAAEAVGLPRDLADELAHRYIELEPWPDARPTLSVLRGSGLRLGVVTNCSETLGRIAVDRLAIPFSTVVTAERAGFYKPHPWPYRLALEELGVRPDRCLFVAGSAYDLAGTAKVGLPTWWHDRISMAVPEGVPTPLVHCRDLASLPSYVLQSSPATR